MGKGHDSVGCWGCWGGVFQWILWDGGWVAPLGLERGWQLASKPLSSSSLFQTVQIGILEDRIEDM